MEEKYQLFAKSENLEEKIYGSIAPSIYGHQFIKAALTLTMFGGVPKTLY